MLSFQCDYYKQAENTHEINISFLYKNSYIKIPSRIDVCLLLNESFFYFCLKMSVEIAADLRISAGSSLNATTENASSDDSYNIFVTIVIVITIAVSFLVLLINKAIIFPARSSAVSTAPAKITNSNNKKCNKSCNFNTIWFYNMKFHNQWNEHIIY